MRSVRLSLLAMLGMALAVHPAVAAPTARSVTVGRDLNVTKTAGNQSEVTIAINPTNTDNIVAVSNVDNADALFEAYTFDGGQTWTRKQIAHGGDLGIACCDPSSAFDRFGNYFLTWLNGDPGSFATDVQAAISTDGGVTLSFLGTVRSAAPVAGSSVAVRSGTGVDQPSLAVGDNSVWFTWKSFASGTPIEARGAAVRGLGQVGALKPVEQAPGSKKGSFGDIAVGPNGEVMVTYQTDTGGQGPAQILVNTDPDGFGSAGFGPEVRVTTTNVGGFDYIPAQAGRSVDAEAGLAWDRSGGAFDGRVYLLYTQEQVNESDDMDILVRTSDDEGATWSRPVRVSDDRTGRSQFLPRIALDQTTGGLAASWYDARSDDGGGGEGDTDSKPNDDAQFWGAVSAPGGARFSPNFRISDGTSNSRDAGNGIDFGDYTGLSFQSGLMYPAWADNSNSTGDNPNGTLHQLDVYTARVTVT